MEQKESSDIFSAKMNPGNQKNQLSVLNGCSQFTV